MDIWISQSSVKNLMVYHHLLSSPLNLPYSDCTSPIGHQASPAKTQCCAAYFTTRCTSATLWTEQMAQGKPVESGFQVARYKPSQATSSMPKTCL